MPIDSILVFAAVLSSLAILSAVMVGGNFRTLARQRGQASRGRRRSF